MTSHASSTPKPGVGTSALSQMVLWSLPLGLLVALTTGVVAWAVRGEAAALSAVAGGVLGLIVFGLGLVAIRGVLSGPAALSMAGAFAVLVGQLALTAVSLVVLLQISAIDFPMAAVGFLVAGLVFQVGVILGYLRSRQLAFGSDVPEPETTSGGAG